MTLPLLPPKFSLNKDRVRTEVSLKIKINCKDAYLHIKCRYQPRRQ